VITVIVGVGKDQETLVLHECLLRESSVFFDNALKGDWKEAHEKTVKLPEIQPADFAAYARFLFTGLLFIKSQSDVDSQADVKLDHKVWRMNLTRCFSLLPLADFLQAPSMEDAIVDAIIEVIVEVRTKSKTYWMFGASFINHIYTYSCPGSPIRQLFVDLCLYQWDLERINGEMCRSDYDIGFLRDYIKAAAPCITSGKKSRSQTDPVDCLNLCKYHNHSWRGEPCYREKYPYLI